VAAVETSERIPTEAELLFQARKALTSDAALALRTVTEHEVRYPKGRLTPEREVLAIEALRQLGRTAEAEARLQRFEARYPKSLHLKRLKQKN
jgi:TolA-binding protein